MSDNELEEFILNLNREAMNYLKQENYAMSLKTLKEADKMLKSIDPSSNIKLQAITLNNFGCFYKRINKPNVALGFLKKACVKEAIEPVDNVNLAGSLLNICAIYSQLGKHDIALENGCKALQLVEKCEASTPNLVSTLIIGYHNTGVEYEFLDNLKQAVECYKSAWQCALKQLGEPNSLTQSIYKSYIEALEKFEKKELRTNLREQLRINGKIHSQDRSRLSTGKQLPDLKVYHKPRSITAKGKLHRRIVSSNVENAVDLAQVRFLTGDRMQPMFKISPQEYSRNTKTVEGERLGKKFFEVNRKGKEPVVLENPGRNVKKIQKKNRKNEIIDETLEEIGEENTNYRTASAPVSIHVGNLQQRIKNLENQYEDFGKKVKPIRDKLPDLESFKVDRIRADYELEKRKNGLDLKHIEINNKNNEEFEQFITDFHMGNEEIEEVKEEIRGNQGKSKENAGKYKDSEGENGFTKNLEREEKEIPGKLRESEERNQEITEKNVLILAQAAFRGYSVRQSMLKLHLAAIIIQKYVRRHQCMMLYITIKEAIVFLQAFFRGHLVRKRQNLKKKP